MEADLLRIWPDLPDDWRARRVPSFRRLLVVVDNLGPDSATARAMRDGHEWSVTDQLLDEVRRDQRAFRQKEGAPYPEPHPMSPIARRTAAEEADRAKQRAEAKARSDAREAARQTRLAAKEDT